MRTSILSLIVGIVVVGAVITALYVPTTLETDPVSVDVPNYIAFEPASAQENLTLVDIFQMSESGTVQIVTLRNDTLSNNSVGSGFVFDKMGHIVTNAHVVRDSVSLEVTFLDGRSYEAELAGADEHTDLAVIKVETDPDLLSPLPIGDSGILQVGQGVAAIGNPFGLSGSMTAGIVSQVGRLLPAGQSNFSIPDVIQTDAAINPGNSGGPLLNMRGEVIGVNTAIQTGTGEFAGVGFAVPSQTVLKIVPTLIEDGEYQHPWIGVSGTDISPRLANVLNLTDTRGFHVVAVVEDSPAHKAGLRGSNQTVQYEGVVYVVGGDVITMVDDVTVRKISDILLHLQRSKAVGDEILVQLLRDGKALEKTIILEKRPVP